MLPMRPMRPMLPWPPQEHKVQVSRVYTYMHSTEALTDCYSRSPLSALAEAMFDTQSLWALLDTIGVERQGFDLLIRSMDSRKPTLVSECCDVLTWAVVAANAIAPLVPESCLNALAFSVARVSLEQTLFDRWFVRGDLPSNCATDAITPPAMSRVLGVLDGGLQVPDSLAMAARMGSWAHRCANMESYCLHGRGAWSFLGALHSDQSAFQTCAFPCRLLTTTLADTCWSPCPKRFKRSKRFTRPNTHAAAIVAHLTPTAPSSARHPPHRHLPRLIHTVHRASPNKPSPATYAAMQVDTS